METLIRNNSMESGNTASPPPHKKQRRFSDFQRDYLIQFYDNTRHYPTPDEYTLFAARFNMSKLRVRTWFQNRRTRQKRRSRVLPLKSTSEPWCLPTTVYEHLLLPPSPLPLPLPLPPSPSPSPSSSPSPSPPIQSDIWDLWVYTFQTKAIQRTNGVLCQNPYTLQIQGIQQQPPTYQGQGFIPSDLYEAQAWLKKQQKWRNHWENVIKINHHHLKQNKQNDGY